MELDPYHLYYKINDDSYYIGNGDIFIHGLYYNSRKTMSITCIKTYGKYYDFIASDSYKEVYEYKIDRNIAFSFNEIIKMWNKYNNYNLDNIHFKLSTPFRDSNGYLFNHIKYKNLSLFDIILYKNLISKEIFIEYNMAFNGEHKEKINKVLSDMAFNEIDIEYECKNKTTNIHSSQSEGIFKLYSSINYINGRI